MPPRWFVLALLVLNVSASLAFAVHRTWPLCLIYAGAAVIQVGTWLWLR